MDNTPIGRMTTALGYVSRNMNSMAKTFSETIKVIIRFRLHGRSEGRWIMMAPNGQNSKERKRNQVKLKGRGKREHKGLAPHRGPGRRH